MRIEISGRTFLFAIGAIAAIWLLLQLWPILLVIVIALMIAGMVAPAIEWLEARRVRRPLAIAMVFCSLLVGVIVFGAITLPRIGAQVANLADRAPELQRLAADKLDATRIGAPFAKMVRGSSGHSLEEAGKALLAYTPRVVEIVAYGVSAVFLAIYFVVDRDRMRGALFALVPRRFHLRLARVFLNLETIVGGYLRGQLLASFLAGTFTFVVLTIAGVPNAIALALFAALTDVLPYIGALLACGPAVIAALEKGPTVAIIVLVVLATYQELESRVIVPRIHGRVLQLPASIILIALLVGTRLLGILGAIVSLPLAAAIRMLVMELRVHLPGEKDADESLRVRDEAAEELFEARAGDAPAGEAAVIATEIAKATQLTCDEEKAAAQPITAGLKTRAT